MAKDIYHRAVREALEKEGWTITHDPYIGQYLNYLVGLEKIEPDRVLYLAIPEMIYNTLIEMELFQLVSAKIGMKIIVFDPENTFITLWKK